MKTKTNKTKNLRRLALAAALLLSLALLLAFDAINGDPLSQQWAIHRAIRYAEKLYPEETFHWDQRTAAGGQFFHYVVYVQSDQSRDTNFAVQTRFWLLTDDEIRGKELEPDHVFYVDHRWTTAYRLGDEAAQQAALAFEQAMYKFETHRALAVCDDYLRAANKRWSDASKAANKLEGEPANAAMTQALVDAFTELRVATVLMHGIVPAGCELICEYFDVDPVAFFSWDNIFASTDEFVEGLGEKPGEHRVKPLPPRFDFFSKHESQY